MKDGVGSSQKSPPLHLTPSSLILSDIGESPPSTSPRPTLSPIGESPGHYPILPPIGESPGSPPPRPLSPVIERRTGPPTPPRPLTPSPKTSPSPQSPSPPSQIIMPSAPSPPAPSPPAEINRPSTPPQPQIIRPSTPPPPPPISQSPKQKSPKREASPSGDKVIEEYYFGESTIEITRKENISETQIEAVSDESTVVLAKPSSRKSSLEPFSRDSLESSPSMQKVSPTLLGIWILFDML